MPSLPISPLKSILGALVLALTFIGPTAADEGSSRFARLSVDDGLVQNSVEDLLQDRFGFLWFGTQEGLNRYDGYHFTVFQARPEPGFLTNSDISALIEDARGDLWVGTAGGLHWLDLDTGRFDPVALPSGRPAETADVVEDSAGRIWFCTEGGGLFVLEPGESGPGPVRVVQTPLLAAEAVVEALAVAETGVWAATGGRLHHVEIEDGEAEARSVVAVDGLGAVSEVAVDGTGSVWIGRPSRELLRHDPSTGDTRGFPQAPRNVLALLPSRDGSLWIGARAGGLTRLDPVTGTAVTHRHDPADPSSLSEDDVAGLYEDRSGTLWIGTWNGGVSRLDPYAQAFRTLKHDPRVPDSLPDDDVLAMAEAPDGRLWLGSRNGVLAVGDPVAQSFEAVLLDLPPLARVTALAHAAGSVLVGTSRGLTSLDPGTGQPLPLSRERRAAGLDDRSIEALELAGETLWIASGRTVLREARRGSEVERFDLPVEGTLSVLFADSADRLLAGTDAGELLVGSRDVSGQGVEFDLAGGPEVVDALRSRGNINSLCEDASGRLWVGTQRGLGVLDDEHRALEWVDREDGLTSPNVVGILMDGDGVLWFGTNRGITRLDPGSGSMALFGSVEGAQGTGYADRAYAAGGSGVFYFAGRGVTAFDPADVILDPNPPQVVLTGLEVLHRQIEPRWQDPESPLEQAIYAAESVTLGPDESVFSVEFAGLHFSDPAGNRYLHRLFGFDPEWIPTNAERRVATYTRLAPGEYVLRVRAGTKTGIWSPREASLTIRVLPPWWRTGPAIAAWVGLVLLVGLALWAEARRRTHFRVAMAEREVLRRASLTDPLTGLYNRRFLESYVEHEVPRVLRAHEDGRHSGEDPTDLLFVLVDLDHFKLINDRFSHVTGDRVLKAVGEVLASEVRGSDLAVRWGGDEFLVVSRFVDHRQASATVERLRRAVEAIDAGSEGGVGPSCSASIGYALFPFVETDPGALTWERSLELADRALILTKNRDRNSWTGLVAGPGLSLEALLEFLDGPASGPLPPGVEVVTP